MKLSERLMAAVADVSSNDVDASMTEAADLLDECESVIYAMRQEIQNLGGSLEGVITADATLAKLRAQERG